MGDDPWQVPNHDPKRGLRRKKRGWRPDAHLQPGEEAQDRASRSRRLHEARNSKYSDEENEIRPSNLARLFIFLSGMALLIFGLSMAFPLSGGMDPYLLRSVIVLLIFGGAAAFWSRASLLKIAKVAGLWAVIILGLSMFYLYQSDFGNRFMSSIDPSGVVSTSEGLLVHRSRDGHFWVRARMNGVLINFMVDTGASSIVLSPDDAKSVGFFPNTLRFTGSAQTANGTVRFARATAASLAFADTVFYDVAVTVNGAEMNGSLLGMSALKRFTSIEFRGDSLILRK
ncbi:MAG: TIGR02281 family clan AA aspartic protease [Kordiimonadaceae bacterium]|nr:TIGR02281 family clan AA aspartic protease [Kordiimonadaceae bacterium]